MRIEAAGRARRGHVSGGPDRALQVMAISSQAAALPPQNPKAVAGSFGALVLASITIITVFKVVDWSAAQTALVTFEGAAVAGFFTALVAHLRVGTSKEPVALAATFTAMVSATLALGSGFGWWSLTEQQTSAVAGLFTALLGWGRSDRSPTRHRRNEFEHQVIAAGCVTTIHLRRDR